MSVSSDSGWCKIKTKPEAVERMLVENMTLDISLLIVYTKVVVVEYSYQVELGKLAGKKSLHGGCSGGRYGNGLV